MLELRRAHVRSRLAGALAAVDSELPIQVPIWIGDDRRAGDGLRSTDPGDPERVVAAGASAGTADVATAVQTAADGARAWAETPARERAAVLTGAASWMRERRLELAALEVRECAKPWPEADADVCEAIDFLEYYARAAIALEAGSALEQAPGEHNELSYVPRGVTAVI